MTNHTDNSGARLGMWLFLYTEIMLFGGLFVLYAAYYYSYTKEFIAAGKELELAFGAANTVVLLASSFTVAASVQAVKKGLKKHSIILLSISIFFAALFLTNKYFEWSNKFSHGIYPDSELLSSGPKGITIFFGLYFTLTGLHALHVLIGASVLAVSIYFIKRGKITENRFNFIENAGLFWHLVDIIWIFLFPLFYLIL